VALPFELALRAVVDDSPFSSGFDGGIVAVMLVREGVNLAGEKCAEGGGWLQVWEAATRQVAFSG
jgi:hypothetical protein